MRPCIEVRKAKGNDLVTIVHSSERTIDALPAQGDAIQSGNRIYRIMDVIYDFERNVITLSVI